MDTTNVLGVFGDWHGNKAWSRAAIQEIAGNGIQYALHMGDFGLHAGNNGQKFLYRVNKTLEEEGIKLLVTLGNHEDYVAVSRLQPVRVEGFEDFRYDRRYPNIYYFQRGQRWEYGGTTFLSVGGANSIDRYRSHRIPNLSWWEGEQISLGDVYRSIGSAGDGVDVFLAHDAPLEVPLFGGHKTGNNHNWSYADLEYAQKSRESLSQIFPAARPKLSFHGHYHFYADHQVTMNDMKGNPFTFRSVGLDMDDHPNNIGLLEVPTLHFEMIDY